MNVLMVAVNARFSHPNLALYSLRSFIEGPGIHTEILEYTIKMPVRDISLAIVDRKPDMLCLSVYIWNTMIIHSLLEGLVQQKFPESLSWILH